jgi:carboxyl-terminal processing protease
VKENIMAYRRFLTSFLALLALIFSVGANAAGPALQCMYLPKLVDLFLKHHYQYETLKDELKDHTTEQFIRRMDTLKTFLLQEDVERIRKELPAVFETAKKGDCETLNGLSALVQKRAKESEDFVREFLGKKYVLDEKVELNLDPKLRSYPKTLEEKRGLLAKVLHFEVSSLLLADIKLAEAKKRMIHRYELITKRFKERKMSDLVEEFVGAFAVGLDPHTSYLSWDDMQDFQIQMQLSLEGIGASLSSQDGFVVIEALIPGGSADRAGQLEPKDKIIMVGQESKESVSVIDMPLREVVKLIRGKKGTKVRLTILRQTEKTESFETTIVRDKIDIKEQAAKIVYQTRKVDGKDLNLGIIDLPSFYGGGESGSRVASVDLRKLLKEAMEKKVDGLILDVSRNGGGLLEEAVRISGFFIRTGGVVATNGQDRKVEVLTDPDEDVVYNGPLVLLTSRISASASEILAGALKDYKRAVVVGGDHTFGKGTVQSVNGLPPGLGAIKVTVGQFFLPGGQSTQQLGVASHVVLPSVLDNDDIGEKTLDYSLPPNSVKAFVSDDANGPEPKSHWAPIDEKITSKLAAQSQARVTAEAKFTEIKKKIEERAKNKGVVKLAEIRKKYREENKTDKKKETKKSKANREAEDLKEYLDNPVLQESLNVLADLIAARA